MAQRTVGFRLVRCTYIILLVLGLIGSSILLLIGLYALYDSQDNCKLYENIMKYYGIDELNFEPVFNDTYLLGSGSSGSNSSLNTTSAIHNNYDDNNNNNNNFNKQNFLATIMVFVGAVSVIFELIGLIGACRDSLVITLTILILMIVGTLSGLFTIRTIDLYTVITQLFFILLAALYVILLKRQLITAADYSRSGGRSGPIDVEMNRRLAASNGGQQQPHRKSGTLDTKYITLDGSGVGAGGGGGTGAGPPPY
ncbi:uncharacterized protein LOC128954205 [Oppia nitens]|uniref:uncharacterized protein LOC128954205 n=1 Tax=Oppia nitens TaxID=1686743 RepID=UPI0023DCB6E6|nr:uncharacterized protein LOC128954205 [Oppia nitens]